MRWLQDEYLQWVNECFKGFSSPKKKTRSGICSISPLSLCWVSQEGHTCESSFHHIIYYDLSNISKLLVLRIDPIRKSLYTYPFLDMTFSPISLCIVSLVFLFVTFSVSIPLWLCYLLWWYVFMLYYCCYDVSQAMRHNVIVERVCWKIRNSPANIFFCPLSRFTVLFHPYFSRLKILQLLVQSRKPQNIYFHYGTSFHECWELMMMMAIVY